MGCFAHFCLGSGLVCWLALTSLVHAQSLETFTVEEPLDRAWRSELIHFDFDVSTADAIRLTDANGSTVPAQFTNVSVSSGRTSGRVYTVTSLEPGQTREFQIRTGTQPANNGPSDVSYVYESATQTYVLRNDRIEVRVPVYGGSFSTPVDVTTLPAPVLGVRRADGTWLGSARWYNTSGQALRVASAGTMVVQTGPMRLYVIELLFFEDGTSAQVDIQLDAGQDAALISEVSTRTYAGAGWHIAMDGALEADRVLWQKQAIGYDYLTDTTKGSIRLAFSDYLGGSETKLVALRPWGFWADMQDGFGAQGSVWAGFYHGGEDDLLGVFLRKPSEWAPRGSELNYIATELLVESDPSGTIVLKMPLVGVPVVGSMRKWGITAGRVVDHVVTTAAPPLRKLVIKHSEFPLDEVKDYGWNFSPSVNSPLHASVANPALLYDAGALSALRSRVAQKVSPLDAQVTTATHQLEGLFDPYDPRSPGVREFCRRYYYGQALSRYLPEAYLGEGHRNPLYAKQLAAALRCTAEDVRTEYLEGSSTLLNYVVPSLGPGGPWVATAFYQLLFGYDLLADDPNFPAIDKRYVENTLLFVAKVLEHPDYWNHDAGLGSGNPNMSSIIEAASGLYGLYLDGHPSAASWVARGRFRLEDDLAGLVSAQGAFRAGAWFENPGYQLAGEVPLLALSQALHHTRGIDTFGDQRLIDSLDYLGALLTPPDVRFPTLHSPDVLGNLTRINPSQYVPGVPHPSTIATVGDMFSGTVSAVHGWVAHALSKKNPLMSARMQRLWRMQKFAMSSGGPFDGYFMPLLDPTLPVAADDEMPDLSRAFEGYGTSSRSSWSDPAASFLTHYTGELAAHYGNAANSLVYYAKGAPLLVNPGDYRAFTSGDATTSGYHNKVSFVPPFTSFDADLPAKNALLAAKGLPGFIDYSAGVSQVPGGGPHHERHVLMVHSENSPADSYLVVRDQTSNGKASTPTFWYNLWSPANARSTGNASVSNGAVHLPGAHGVDLDVFFLSPSAALASPIPLDSVDWGFEVQAPNHSDTTYHWSGYTEHLQGIHVPKVGSAEDFFTVLYPRAAGEQAPRVTSFAGGAATRISHSEGTDWVLLSPDQVRTAMDGETVLSGTLAAVRSYQDGRISLAVTGAGGTVRYGEWQLESMGPAGLEITSDRIHGRVDGASRTISVSFPSACSLPVRVTVDKLGVWMSTSGQTITIAVPAGPHELAIIDADCDDAPEPPSAGLSHWYRADGCNADPNTPSVVCLDRMGGSPWTSGSSTEKPSLAAEGLGGKPTLVYAASTPALDSNANATGPIANELTMSVVASIDESGLHHTLWTHDTYGQDGQRNRLELYAIANGVAATLYVVSIEADGGARIEAPQLSATVPLGQPFVATIRSTVARSELYVNGELVSTSFALRPTALDASLGGPGSKRLSEVFVYDHALNPSEDLAALHRYAAKRYGIALNIPPLSGMHRWYRADSCAQSASTEATVCLDRMGGTPLTFESQGAQPTVSSIALSGKPALIYSDATAPLDSSPDPNVAPSNEVTISVVGSILEPGIHYTLWGHDTYRQDGKRDRLGLYAVANAVTATMYLFSIEDYGAADIYRAYLSGSVPLNQPFVATIRGTSTGSEFYINGDRVGTSGPLMPTALAFSLGSPGDKRMGELIVYDRPLEPNEMAALHHYVYGRYGMIP